ncbi:hypothetical protein BJY52DRAFT_1419778 [Lactarius psammicola]|nr:hypothetical protein BJY52DRAFT_1419778 [Lactarius psammicola]
MHLAGPRQRFTPANPQNVFGLQLGHDHCSGVPRRRESGQRHTVHDKQHIWHVNAFHVYLAQRGESPVESCHSNGGRGRGGRRGGSCAGSGRARGYPLRSICALKGSVRVRGVPFPLYPFRMEIRNWRQPCMLASMRPRCLSWKCRCCNTRDRNSTMKNPSTWCGRGTVPGEFPILLFRGGSHMVGCFNSMQTRSVSWFEISDPRLWKCPGAVGGLDRCQTHEEEEDLIVGIGNKSRTLRESDRSWRDGVQTRSRASIRDHWPTRVVFFFRL